MGKISFSIFILLVNCISLLANYKPCDWFVSGLKWDEIKAKAKAEHKFIFLDCYASWCGPCKAMDKEVYSLEKVGRFMDQCFISVKVQMDTTEHDNADVKQWYASANEISQSYGVTVFPNLLFFSPEGKAVHKDIGYHTADEFIHIAIEALNPKTQYYSLVEEYKKGKRDYTTMLCLIQQLNRFKERKMAKEVAKNYLQNYLYHLQPNALYTKINLRLIAPNVEATSEIGFKVFFDHKEEVDHVMGKSGYAESIVENMIYRIEIQPELAKFRMLGVQTPEWDQLAKRITNKFGAEACEDPLLEARFTWYLEKMDWPEVVKSTLARIERVQIDTSTGGMTLLNNKLFELVFKHATDTIYLNKAIQLQQKLVMRNPNSPDMLDTYANLLYKIGRKEDAINCESRAVMLAPGNDDMQKALNKMKRGEPTWE